MVRILSALVLIPLVVAAVWFLPPLGLLVVAEAVLWLAFFEYVRICECAGARFSRTVAGCAAAATCVAVAWPGGSADSVLMAAVLAMCATAVAEARVGVDVLGRIFAGLFASL